MEDEAELADQSRPAVLSVYGDGDGGIVSLAPRALLQGRREVPDQVSGNAGRPALVNPGQIETLARIRADDPRAQTAMVALAAPPTLPGNTFIFALLQWGTDGVTQQAVCDFLRGQQLSISGSWIQVSGGNESVSASPVILGASLAYGYARGNAVVPTRTLRHSVLSGPATVVFDVPAFAVNLRYYREPVAAGPVWLEFLDPAGGIVYDQQIVANASQDIPIPIAADCTQVRVRIIATNLNSGRLIFGLAL